MKLSTKLGKNIACVLYMKIDQFSKWQNGLFSPYKLYFEICISKFGKFVVSGFLGSYRTLWVQRKPNLNRAHTFQVKICPNHYFGSKLNSKNDFGEIPIGLV